MFYPEFIVSTWSYFIPFLVLVGVLYALGAKYLETHLSCLYPFFPEGGATVLTEKEAARLRVKEARLSWAWAAGKRFR